MAKIENVALIYEIALSKYCCEMVNEKDFGVSFTIHGANKLNPDIRIVKNKNWRDYIEACDVFTRKTREETCLLGNTQAGILQVHGNDRVNEIFNEIKGEINV